MDSLGVDGNGNRININLKADEELQFIAHLIGATLKEQKCDPDEYMDNVFGAFLEVFPEEEIYEFLNIRKKRADYRRYLK